MQDLNSFEILIISNTKWPNDYTWNKHFPRIGTDDDMIWLLLLWGGGQGVGLSLSRPLVSLLPSWSGMRFARATFSSFFLLFFCLICLPSPSSRPSSPAPSPSSPSSHPLTSPSRSLISRLPITLSSPSIMLWENKFAWYSSMQCDEQHISLLLLKIKKMISRRAF